MKMKMKNCYHSFCPLLFLPLLPKHRYISLFHLKRAIQTLLSVSWTRIPSNVPRKLHPSFPLHLLLETPKDYTSASLYTFPRTLGSTKHTKSLCRAIGRSIEQILYPLYEKFLVTPTIACLSRARRLRISSFAHPFLLAKWMNLPMQLF